jgi:hypothetical protein
MRFNRSEFGYKWVASKLDVEGSSPFSHSPCLDWSVERKPPIGVARFRLACSEKAVACSRWR